MPFKEKGKLISYNQIEGYLLLPLMSTSGDFVVDEDDLRDAMTLFGLKASHSVHYYFTDQLALMGDVGFNIIFWDNSDTDIDEGYDYIRTTTEEVSMNLGMTYSKLSLLFTF